MFELIDMYSLDEIPTWGANIPFPKINWILQYPELKQ